MGIRSLNARFQMHAIFNAYWEPLTFALPPVPAGGEPWRRCMDTALESPDDVLPFGAAPAVERPSYEAHARSVVMLARQLA
jgi:glycogen operon protein